MAVSDQIIVMDHGVIAQRDKLVVAATAAGVTLPGTLQSAFERDGGLAGASVEAQAEQATVDAIVHAEAARPTEHGAGERLIIGVGLLLADPEPSLVAARTALAAGDLETAYASAQSADSTWAAAASVGRSRMLSAALLLLALLAFAGLIRQHNRRSRSEAPG